MAKFDYDLVVVGNTAIAHAAARSALAAQARVALVTQTPPEGAEVLPWLVQHQIWMQSLRQPSLWHDPLPEKRWLTVKRWAQTAIADRQQHDSPLQLMLAGVDVIPGMGQFKGHPRLRLQVGDRAIFSRTYLLAPEWRLRVVEISGLQQTPHWTIGDLWQQPTLPARITVLGKGTIAIELSQLLATLGVHVTLVSGNTRILPQEDPDLSLRMQAGLEAVGVQVISHHPITQVRAIQGKPWVQAGKHALEADALVVALGQSPDYDSLNLAAAGVHRNQRGVLTLDTLQSSQPRIYAYAGHSPSGWNPQAVTIAVENALFWPRQRFHERLFPWVSWTTPTLARIGLTESQARAQFPQEIQILTGSLRERSGETWGDAPGYLKLLVRRRGEIVGAQGIGVDGAEWMTVLALALQQRQTISQLGRSSLPPTALSDCLQRLAIQWARESAERKPGLNLQAVWLNWRRLGFW